MCMKDYKMNYEAAVSNVFRIAAENSPLRVKAVYISCKFCGSRLAKKYLRLTGKTCNCPVCGHSLFSQTAKDRIKKAEEKARKIKDAWENENAKSSTCKQPTYESALKDTRNRLELILDEHKSPDFTEIIGKIGGDVLTFRVYKDGSVYEK